MASNSKSKKAAKKVAVAKVDSSGRKTTAAKKAATRGTAITTEQTYNSVMARIHMLMKKGDGNLTNEEEAALRTLALAAQAYEHSIYTIPKPATLEGLLELSMYQRHLKQGEMATMLGVSNTKFSMILSGKQKPDIPFLKAVHKELNIDANQLLEMV